MGKLDKIKNYILEEQFKIIYQTNQLDIINYKTMGHFDDTKVLIYHEQGLLEIKGQKLVVSKLLKDEVLIKGNIEKIEFR